MNRYKITVTKEKIDMTEYDELMDTLKAAKRRADKLKAEVTARIREEGIARHTAIMEQCAEIAERARVILAVKNVSQIEISASYRGGSYFKTFSVVVTENCFNISDDWSYKGVWDDSYLEDKSSWLYMWNKENILGQLLNRLKQETLHALEMLEYDAQDLRQKEENLLG